MISEGLVVIPTQGFCNRLRMIASASIYANLRNTPLYICWRPSPDCNINLDDFLLKDTVKTVTFETLTSNNTIYFGRIHTSNIIYKIDEILDCKDILGKYLVIEGGHEFRHREMTNLDFVYRKHQFYKYLSFKHDIIQRVDLMLKDINLDDTIGVHYRNIDNIYDKMDIENNANLDFTKNSDIESFINMIRLSNKKNVMVISNSSYAYNTIKNRLDEKNIMNTGLINYKRNKCEGILDSIIDFIILSRMNIVIGSFYSSFSDEASFVNYIPKIMPVNIGNIKANNNGSIVYHCHGFSYSGVFAINDNKKILFDTFGDNISKVENMYHIDV